MADAGRRVLVLRPEPGASVTATALEEAGFQPVLLPLTEIVALPAPEASFSGRFSAVAATSANALRHAPRELLAGLADTPLFAVGEATAAIARAAGFQNVEAGAGDAQAMAELMRHRLNPENAVLYLCGRVRTPLLEQGLIAAGLGVVAVETYDTVATKPSPIRLKALADGGALDAVLVHSANAARRLADLESDLATLFANTLHVCVSDRAAVPLAGSTRRTIIAHEPTEAAMIAAVRAAF